MNYEFLYSRIHIILHFPVWIWISYLKYEFRNSFQSTFAFSSLFFFFYLRSRSCNGFTPLCFLKRNVLVIIIFLIYRTLMLRPKEKTSLTMRLMTSQNKKTWMSKTLTLLRTNLKHSHHFCTYNSKKISLSNKVYF